jgi:hypothetical protein
MVHVFTPNPLPNLRGFVVENPDLLRKGLPFRPIQGIPAINRPINSRYSMHPIRSFWVHV